MPMPPIQKQLLEQRLTAFCERRIPPHVRDQIHYDRQKGHFSLYCADRNDKWYRYDPFESTTDIDAILQEIDEDPTGIFWG